MSVDLLTPASAENAPGTAETRPDPFADRHANQQAPSDPAVRALEFRMAPQVGFLYASDPTPHALAELVEKWKQAGNKADRAKIEQSLQAVLKEQFASRLGAHEKEIEQLEAEVKRLRDQLDLRRKKQGEIIEFRMEQILREAQGLGWGPEPEGLRNYGNFQVQPVPLGYDPRGR